MLSQCSISVCVFSGEIWCRFELHRNYEAFYYVSTDPPCLFCSLTVIFSFSFWCPVWFPSSAGSLVHNIPDHSTWQESLFWQKSALSHSGYTYACEHYNNSTQSRRSKACENTGKFWCRHDDRERDKNQRKTKRKKKNGGKRIESRKNLPAVSTRFKMILKSCAF